MCTFIMKISMSLSDSNIAEIQLASKSASGVTMVAFSVDE